MIEKSKITIVPSDTYMDGLESEEELMKRIIKENPGIEKDLIQCMAKK